MRLLLIAALLLGACVGSGAPGSGVRGTVVAGPACPGPARVESPCPDRPVRITIEVVRNGAIAATVTTGDDGRFSVAVPAGTYTLRSRAGLPALRPTAVTVLTDAFTDVELHADTGIR